jgi:hypothetical protein
MSRLKPRSKSTVKRNLLPKDSDSGNLLPKNNHFINPNAKNIRLLNPDCYRKGGTYSVRIWNMLDPEDPTKLLNGRLDTNDVAGLGGVSISEPVYICSYAGIHPNNTPAQNINYDAKDCNPVSYIIARDKESVVDGISFWEEPYIKFSKVAKDAAKSGRFAQNRKWDSDWNCLLSAKMPAISKWKQQYFIIGSVYNNGPDLDLVREHIHYESGNKSVDKEIARDGVPLGDRADDPLVVTPISVSTGRKILQMFCKPKETAVEGNLDLNPSLMYKYGDPCGIYNHQTRTVKDGVFVHLFNPDKFLPKQDTKKGEKDPYNVFNRQLSAYSTYVPGQSAKEIIEYEVSLSTMIPGPNGALRPSLTTEQVENITSKHLFFWREDQSDPADSFLLYEPSIEERCLWIAKAFRFVPQLVELCWMSNPEYLEFDSVKAVLRNRTQVTIPDAADDINDPAEEEEAFQPEPVVKKNTSKASTQKLPEVDSVLDDVESFDSFDDQFSTDNTEPAKNKAEKIKSAPASKADELVDSFDDEFGDEIELEQGDTEDQFEASDDGFDASDEVSADFDPVEEDNTSDTFEDQIEKSLSTAKAISRAKARSSKPKQ